jgi:hypothetical protein
MRVFIKIQVHPRMDSESSIRSSIKALIPLVENLHTDIQSIEEKIRRSKLSWLETPVVPTAPPLKELWNLHKIPEEGSIHTLLSSVLLRAREVDVRGRTVVFSDEDAKILDTKAMTIFEFLHIIIDSVIWL